MSYFYQLPTRLRIEQPKKRRVFFSFHYQEDIWRVNQVRNSWRYRHENDREAFGFYDASMWEKSKREGDESLKWLIRAGIDNTSVTCVLAGSQTYLRKWVKYEIARSVIKKNGLLTVKIHRMRNQEGVQSVEGANPLDYMGLCRDNNGRLFLVERNVYDEWSWYQDYTLEVELTSGWQEPGQYVMALSSMTRVYDYVTDFGSAQFSDWIATAAMEADR